MSGRNHEPRPSGLLSGELSLEQVDELLARAERDPEVSAELDLVADLTAAAELSETGESPRPLTLTAPAAPRWKGAVRLLIPLAAAAAVIALLFFGPDSDAFRSGDSRRLAALESWEAAPDYLRAGAQRGIEGELHAAFDAAMEGYREQDWPRTVEQLTRFLEVHPEHGPARLYRGIARVQSSDHAGALDDFDRVASSNAGFLADHAAWRGALCLLRLERSDEGLAGMRALAEAGGPFAPNARAFLELR